MPLSQHRPRQCVEGRFEPRHALAQIRHVAIDVPQKPEPGCARGKQNCGLGIHRFDRSNSATLLTRFSGARDFGRGLASGHTPSAR